MIFIAHSKKDRRKVLHLFNSLKGYGFSSWLDEHSLIPGQDWQLEIERAIRSAKVFLICFSSRWIDTQGYVHKELRLAFDRLLEMPEGHIFILPLRLDDCNLPHSVSKLHWLDLHKPGGLPKLLNTLKQCYNDKDSISPGSSLTDGQILRPGQPMYHSPPGGLFSMKYFADGNRPVKKRRRNRTSANRRTTRKRRAGRSTRRR